MLVAGCVEWNSVPTVVDRNLGHAYVAMVANQTLCLEHGKKAKDPNLCPEHGPVIGMDGQKAQGSIAAYRAPPKLPLEASKTGATFTGEASNMSGGQ